MQQQRNGNDLEKYLADDLFREWILHNNPEGQKYWEQYLAKYPEDRSTLEKAKGLLLAWQADQKQARFQKARNWQRIQHTLGPLSENSHLVVHRNAAPDTWKYNSWWQYAAAVALLVVGIGWFWLVQSERQVPASEVVATTPSYLEKTAGPGQKIQLRLTDGSVVKLNAGASIRFLEQFEADKRVVYLQGEAFFDVAHDPERPFIVYANGLETRVLGTSFNVKSLPDQNTSIAVKTGRVQVRQGEQSGGYQQVQLSPMQKAVYSGSTQKITVAEAVFLADFAWKDNLLVFQDADCTTLKASIENWFGVTIEIVKPAKGGCSCKFNGIFENESLQNVLDNVTLAIGAEYTIVNKHKVQIMFH